MGLQSKDLKRGLNRNILISRGVSLQDKEKPPSEAVYSGSYDEHGMWNARPGTTFLNFSISSEKDSQQQDSISSIDPNTSTALELPGSFWNKKAGGIRYIVSASVESKAVGGSKPRSPLVSHLEFQLFERNNVTAAANSLEKKLVSSAATSSDVGNWISGKGEVNLKVQCLDSVRSELKDSNCVWQSGGLGSVEVSIENASKRKVI